jgi:alpha-tubulin suppressor-like RCC1 family protein
VEEPHLLETIPQSAQGVLDISLGVYHAAILTTDGKVLTFGFGENGQVCNPSRTKIYFSSLDCHHKRM